MEPGLSIYEDSFMKITMWSFNPTGFWTSTAPHKRYFQDTVKTLYVAGMPDHDCIWAYEINY